MQGREKHILLPFTKDMLLASVNGTKDMEVEENGYRVTVYYKLKSERIAGVDEVEFPCKCMGKHPTEFLPVDD